MEKPPKTSQRHGQITKALKDVAKDLGKAPNDVYNQFFREVFLHELMRHHSGWVLKGGTNVYCRIPGARQTKDLDLYRQDSPTSAAEAADALVAALDGHRVGPYVFRIAPYGGTEKLGTIESKRLMVTVTHGINNTLLSFGVDVSGDLRVSSAVETLNVAASYEVRTEFLPQTFQVVSYPVANQIADKVCAMYERHGKQPPGRASTRYHDLFDIALLASELPETTRLSAHELDAALASQSEVRELRLPRQLTLPDETWVNEYSAKAKRFNNGVRPELENLDTALEVAGLLVTPVLSGQMKNSSKTWSSAALSWS